MIGTTSRIIISKSSTASHTAFRRMASISLGKRPLNPAKSVLTVTAGGFVLGVAAMIGLLHKKSLDASA